MKEITIGIKEPAKREPGIHQRFFLMKTPKDGHNPNAPDTVIFDLNKYQKQK